MAKGFTLFSLKMKFSLYQQAEALIALIAIPFLLFFFFLNFFKAGRNKIKNGQEAIFFYSYFYGKSLLFLSFHYAILPSVMMWLPEFLVTW